MDHDSRSAGRLGKSHLPSLLLADSVAPAQLNIQRILKGLPPHDRDAIIDFCLRVRHDELSLTTIAKQYRTELF